MEKKLINEITENILNDPDFDIMVHQDILFETINSDPVNFITHAGRISRKYKSNNVFTCAILNAKSGVCSQDCAFCAQSAFHNTGIAAYPLHDCKKLVSSALEMEKKRAVNFSFVTSGHTISDKELIIISDAVKQIREQTSLSLCASLGQLTQVSAKELKNMGITRYHHNLETAESYFNKICTTHEYHEDINTLNQAKQAGLYVCSGGIFGLGETWAQRVELLVTLKALDVDSIPINFLIPVAGTKMENRSILPPIEALCCIALARFINPTKDIPICGGREKTLKDFQSWLFLSGANGLMIGNYLTTMGRSVEMDIEMIAALDLKIESINR